MLSHGESNGFFYAADDKLPIDVLWRYFTADKCENLKGKPKLFFVQACRGSMVDDRTPAKSHAGTDNAKAKLSSLKPSKPNIPEGISSMSDILVFFSSAEGFCAIRDPLYGSVFIQTICHEFWLYLQSSDPEDLLRILTRVNSVISRTMFNYEYQMPTIRSHLTKSLIFYKTKI